jgi:hypothetical protein
LAIRLAASMTRTTRPGAFDGAIAFPWTSLAFPGRACELEVPVPPSPAWARVAGSHASAAMATSVAVSFV